MYCNPTRENLNFLKLFLTKQNETYILCKASGAIEEDSEHGVSKIVTDVLILHSTKFEERGAQI